MSSESRPSRNPAGHSGLLDTAVALISAVVEFFESRSAMATQESRIAGPALRTGFPGQIPQVIPKADGFLDLGGSRCRGADRIGTNAEEKNLCRRTEPP